MSTHGQVHEAPWHHHVMWWQVYPLGFVGAPVRPEPAERDTGVVHRLGRLEAWLDHLLALGLNGLSLGPVFAAQTHGYDTVDHFRIDSRLGDEADFDSLVAAARARGIRVLLDGVFNHVGRTHPGFRALEAEGPSAATADWFRVRWDGWAPGNPVDADVFEGHDQLVTLDHRSPAVADLVIRVMTHWLDRGVDGWRLDAAYAVEPEFWAEVLPRVRRHHPGAWFTGEVIHGDYTDVVRRSSMDSLTQYELWQGIWHAIVDRNFHELAHALERHNRLLSTFVPSTFVGNHDVTRIASAVGTDLVPHALAVMLCVAGTPSIYAGDEYAMTGTKLQQLGGDDAVRPEFPSEPPPEEELEPAAKDTVALHRDLVALRRRRPWLRSAHSDVVHVTNQQLVIRTATGDGAVVVALNLDDAAADVPAADARTVLLGRAELQPNLVRLPPRGWSVLEA